ncbi:hypothetical protein [Paenibacillus sp. SI8]|uniref:hypothetical protein n=1 Tax=unclassified Paenibacillus TaxID=185978 RepID=UPI003467D855
MFDLFRFIMLRPTEYGNDKDSIIRSGDSRLLSQLEEAKKSEDPDRERKRIADHFISDSPFIRHASDLKFGVALEQFERLLKNDPPGDLAGLQAALIRAFDLQPGQLADHAEWQQDKQRLFDSLLALKLADSQAGIDMGMLSRNLRLIDLAERIAAKDEVLNTKAAWTQAMSKPIAFPQGLLTLTRHIDTKHESANRTIEEENRPEQEQNKQLDNLLLAQSFLSGLEPDDLEYEETNDSPIPTPEPQEPRDSEKILRRLDVLSSSLLNLEHKGLDQVLASRKKAIEARELPLMVKRGKLALVNTQIRAALESVDLDLARHSVPYALKKVSAELEVFKPAIDIGSWLTGNGETYQKEVSLQDGRYDPVPMKQLPETYGKLKPVGVADLLVVKQQIVGYEAGEVAFIENVLQGESFVRTVSRKETTEYVTITENETMNEEERDLQSTERFEVRRESEQVASTSANMQSSAYGGLQETTNTSKENTERQASTFGKEVTSRAVSKITERSRTQITRRTLQEFQETSNHQIDNNTGAGPVVGVYQWIDKVYEAQTYQYGKRLLYDMVIPEPGAFLLQAMALGQFDGRELIEPDPFYNTPEGVKEGNYRLLAAKYQATGIEPPPAKYVFISKGYSKDANQGVVQSEVLQVPPGYKASKGYVNLASWSSDADERASIDVTVGDKVNTYNGSTYNVLTFTFPDLPDQGAGHVPVSILSFHIIEYALGVGITCTRTPELYKKWQQRTYDILVTAYQRRKADYEERLANLQAALRVGVIGLSPPEKIRLSLEELKKNCISLITQQNYDGFNGINYSNQKDPVSGKTLPIPQISVSGADLQGSYIRFFEQAFEWEQMMHSLYSYFWGRKNHWLNKMSLEERDSEFAKFLRAGAARVVVPVRPGFEEAVIHFMETGKIWNEQGLPDIHDELYVPLLKEIHGQTDGKDAGTPYGEPWRIKLPTSLVKLRTDGQLPTWKKQGGEWVNG